MMSSMFAPVLWLVQLLSPLLTLEVLQLLLQLELQQVSLHAPVLSLYHATWRHPTWLLALLRWLLQWRPLVSLLVDP